MLDQRMFEIIKMSLGENHVIYYPKDFNKRIIVQKTLYLLSHGKNNPKIKLPYKWSYYIRGPYSSEIAHQFYYLEEFDSDVIGEGYRLEQNDQVAINHFLRFREKITRMSGIERIYEHDYEVLATIVYIGLQFDNPNRQIIDKLHEHKKQLPSRFTSDLLNKYRETLIDFQYI